MQHNRPIVHFVVLLIVILGLLAVSRQDVAPPRNINDICHLFKHKRQWYRAARAARRRWGVPISTQMAIIFVESRFRASARPSRLKLFGVLPWRRPSSAVGYAQVVDSTWLSYRRATQQPMARRQDFTKAVDFIGWYLNRIHAQLGISRKDTYHLYLAYHEGVRGYRSGAYRRHPRTIKVAAKVEARAHFYRRKLLRCEGGLG